MAKFKVNSNKFLVLLSGKATTDSYFTSIRIEVKGVVTKQTNMSSWQGDIYYGTSCYLPEKKSAKSFIKQYVNGKTFISKYKRHINAVHKYETKSQKEVLLANMLCKINHLIDNSFS